MPKRRPIAKRQRPIEEKERQPAVLKKIKNDVQGVVSVDVSIGERELMFARALADTEERVRTASLISLRTWLEENAGELDDAQLDKLWKGLFYCIWMADKRPRISAAIRDVIALEDILGVPHICAMFRCLVREWFGIDKHRVDKFYELLNVSLEVYASRALEVSSDEELRKNVNAVMAFISDELISKANKGSKGILMHVLDKWTDVIFAPILKKAASFSRNSVHWTWDRMLEPFLELLKSSDGRLDGVKVKFEERVLMELNDLMSCESMNLNKRTVYDCFNRVSKSVFAAASEADISEECRKRLYDIRKSLKVILVELKPEAYPQN